MISRTHWHQLCPFLTWERDNLSTSRRKGLRRNLLPFLAWVSSLNLCPADMAQASRSATVSVTILIMIMIHKGIKLTTTIGMMEINSQQVLCKALESIVWTLEMTITRMETLRDTSNLWMSLIQAALASQVSKGVRAFVKKISYWIPTILMILAMTISDWGKPTASTKKDSWSIQRTRASKSGTCLSPCK